MFCGGCKDIEAATETGKRRTSQRSRKRARKGSLLVGLRGCWLAWGRFGCFLQGCALDQVWIGVVGWKNNNDEI
eukprot:86553-Prorocentrum_lima.AAC.1